MELVILIPVILAVILWIWALTNLIRSRFETTTTQLLWLIVILIAPILGSILYLVLRDRFVVK